MLQVQLECRGEIRGNFAPLPKFFPFSPVACPSQKKRETEPNWYSLNLFSINNLRWVFSLGGAEGCTPLYPPASARLYRSKQDSKTKFGVRAQRRLSHSFPERFCAGLFVAENFHSKQARSRSGRQHRGAFRDSYGHESDPDT